MKTFLKMHDGLFEDLTAHLLPLDSVHEQAAFLFVSTNKLEDRICFSVLETMYLRPDEFDSQFCDYLELSDNTWARLIKHAYNLDASLVEIHSHLGPYSAAFSLADFTGLKKTIPYIWWRLKKRPYLAIVVTATGFDALVWLDDPNIPQQLDGIIAGERLLCPSNNSLGEWK